MRNELGPYYVLDNEYPCFECKKWYPVLKRYICGNGEFTEYCESCLKEMQGDRYKG